MYNFAKLFIISLALILLTVVISALVGYAAYNIIMWLGLLAPFLAIITAFTIGIVLAAAIFTAIVLRVRKSKTV